MNDKNSVQILEAIKLAIPVFADNQNSEWHELEESLVKVGISPLLAIKLIEFMPLAFGRVHLEAKGFKFDDYYIRQNPNTKKEIRKKLNDEPVYQEAFEVASYIVATNRVGEAFMAIVYRSAELWCINDMLKQGSKPESILGLPPLLQWNDECENEQTISQQSTKKKW